MKQHSLITALFLLLLLAGGGYWQANHLLRQPKTIASTTVTVLPGAGANTVIRQLQRAGIIDHPQLLRLYARLRGQSGHIQAGWYHFSGNISPIQALQTLVDGDVMQFQLTVPEGLRSAEILPLLAQKSGIALTQWQHAWQQLGGSEGILLPDSLHYTKPLQPLSLLQRMADAQTALLATLEPDRKQWPRLRIIASIIEKESALDAERPIISAVIRNRLQRHMPLQMDPTVIYGLYQQDGRFSGDITHRDLKRDTPWNSYLHRGLPPTPICHPGRSSLIAAAHPDSDRRVLYFVANGRGGHAFATSLRQHQRHVANLLRQSTSP